MPSSTSKPKSLGELWGGMDLASKLIVMMTLGLIIGAFFLGYFSGQLTALKGKGVLGANNLGAAQPAQQQAAAEPAGPLSDDQWEEVLANPAAVKGDEDAKVTIVEFTDYECPFCSRHFTQTDPQVQQEYVDTGKVRYITRDLPLPFHSNAHIASQAARCAGDQGKYWEMHDVLFENQEEWSTGDAAASFDAYAAELGLNVGTFSSCVSNETHAQAVDDDLALAGRVGASGTPTFFINGQILVGAQPFEAFKTLIEKEL